MIQYKRNDPHGYHECIIIIMASHQIPSHHDHHLHCDFHIDHHLH